MKKGFTLIELLAVIVILAIIALIATPIILGIINDAREESNERSVELYASAVRNAIASYQLTGLTAPKSFSDLTVEYEGKVECTTKELYEDGSFYLEGCTVNGSEKTYSYGTKQEKLAYLSEICEPVEIATAGAYTAGDKYECKVDPNKEAYTFYVLTSVGSEATSVNLIMDSNITSTGEAIKDTNPTDTGLVAWLSYADYTALGGPDLSNDEGACQYGGICISSKYGPITAMDYIQTATANWTNVNTQTVSTFTDDSGATHNMAKTYTTYARLPYISEVVATGCGIEITGGGGEDKSGTCPLWMVNYLDGKYYQYEGRKGVSGVGGYWTLSSDTHNPDQAWNVDCHGYANNFSDVNYDSGGRPVINLSI